MNEDQAPLFDWPAPPPRQPRMAAPRKAVSYVRYRPRTHQLCDDCVRAIHEQGQGNAPFPRTVRWRRVEHQSLATTQLCEQCKQARETNDVKGT